MALLCCGDIPSVYFCRDISFLYDVPRDFPHPEKPDSNDASAVRKTAEIPPKKVDMMQCMCTLSIPGNVFAIFNYQNGTLPWQIFGTYCSVSDNCFYTIGIAMSLCELT